MSTKMPMAFHDWLSTPVVLDVTITSTCPLWIALARLLAAVSTGVAPATWAMNLVASLLTRNFWPLTSSSLLTGARANSPWPGHGAV
ncbi:hypothetical protein D3C72_2234630 [compost metagenome]